MTICIAAVGWDEDNSLAIVLCTDGKGSTPVGSKDRMRKIHDLPLGWKCLTAGGEDDINAFLRLLRAELKGVKSINETNIERHIQEAFRKRKEEKADAHTIRNWGTSYETFLKRRSQFPEAEYAAEIVAIRSIVNDVECIVTGFDDSGLPLLVHANGCAGFVGIVGDFAVAGSGSDLARFALLYRKHDEYQTLDRTIYCAYEAKRHAQSELHVNEVTAFRVLHRDGRESWLKHNGRAELEQRFKQYGPRDLDDGVLLPAECFVSLRAETMDPID